MFDLMLRCFGLRKEGDIEEPYDYYVKLFTMTMRITGLWKSSQDRNWNPYIAVPASMIAIVGIIAIFASVYDTRHDFTVTIETLLYQILLIHSFYAYLILIFNRNNIISMIEAVESRFQNYEQRSLPEMTTIKKSAEVSSIWLSKVLVLVVSSVHVSHVIASKFYLPNSDSKTLFFSMILPYQLHENYYLAFALELIIYIFEGIVNLSSITINVAFLNILCYEVDVFGLSLQGMNGGDFNNNQNTIGKDLNNDNLTKITVKDIVCHHKYLIRLSYHVQSVLSYIVMDMFVTCEFMLCLCSFQIYQIYSTTTFASLMKNVCMLSALIVHEFVYFFYGQRLVTKTSNLHQSVYLCKWYNESKSFKSSLSIIHCRTAKPFVIMAAKIVPVTLASFIKCLQAAFSYFNLLRALSHT